MSRIAIYAGTLVLLFATWWEMRRGIDTPDWQLANSLETIPTEWGGYTSSPTKLAVEDLDVLQPTSYLMRTYHGSPGFQLMIAYFAAQHAGKSMHSPKNCLPSAGWEAVESRTLQVPVGQESLPVNLYRIRSGERTLMMLYWYQSVDRVAASEARAKGYLLFDRMLNHRSPGSIVRITLDDKPENLEIGVRAAGWLIAEMRRCIGTHSR